jgi:RNA polymerase sigma-70 factor (ECF subfamily)
MKQFTDDSNMADFQDPEKVLKGCQRGEIQAQEAFYRMYSGLVYRLSLQILKNKDLADDALQDIFIKVFRSLPEYKQVGKVTTWLYRVTLNHCRDVLRQRERQKKRLWWPKNQEESTESPWETIPDPGIGPAREQEEQQIRQIILEAVNRLPLEFREAYYLKEFEGLSYEEIAEVAGCRIGTVKSRIFRARELLKDLLKEYYREITGKIL